MRSSSFDLLLVPRPFTQSPPSSWYEAGLTRDLAWLLAAHSGGQSPDTCYFTRRHT